MVILSARDARAVVFGVTVTLLVAPLTVEPAPPVLVLAFRVVAALVGGYILWLSVRPARTILLRARLGGTSEATFVGLAFALALLIPHSGPGPAGPPALAAAVATGLAGANLLAFGPDPLRLGGGAIVFLVSASLGAAWLGGAAGDAAQLGVAMAALAASVATGWISLNAHSAVAEPGVGPALRPSGAIPLAGDAAESREAG